MTQLGKNIRIALLIRGYSALAFSKRVRISRNYLSLLENNKAIPSLPLLIRIARHLRIEPWMLLHPTALQGYMDRKDIL